MLDAIKSYRQIVNPLLKSQKRILRNYQDSSSLKNEPVGMAAFSATQQL